MSDVSTLTGTATFSRKVNKKQYEPAEAGLFVQFTYDPDLSDDALIAEAMRAQRVVQIAVLESLGIAWSLDPSGERVVEQEPTGVAAVASAFQGSTVTETPAAQQGSGVGPTPPAKTGDKRNDSAAMKTWGLARFATNPDEFYDNRPKKASGEYKPTSPDIKHKASGEGIWL